MTPIKTVIGGPKVNNEPPFEPVEEEDAAKDQAAAGSMKAAPEVGKD